MRQQDLDEVDFGPGQHGVEVLLDGDTFEPPGCRAPFGPLRVPVAEGDDPRPRIGQVLDRVQIGNPARACDADSDGPGAHRVASSRIRMRAAMLPGVAHP